MKKVIIILLFLLGIITYSFLSDSEKPLEDTEIDPIEEEATNEPPKASPPKETPIEEQIPTQEFDKKIETKIESRREDTPQERPPQVEDSPYQEEDYNDNYYDEMPEDAVPAPPREEIREDFSDDYDRNEMNTISEEDPDLANRLREEYKMNSDQMLNQEEQQGVDSYSEPIDPDYAPIEEYE